MEILGIDFAYRLIKISDLQLMKSCITFAPETKDNDNKTNRAKTQNLGIYDKTMTAPSIETSTQEQRLAYVVEQWKCLSNCEMCGKCSVLRGGVAELLYVDYIEGRRSYMEITLELRNRNI